MTQRAGRAGRGTGSARPTPLYKRLPHGPHRLGRDEVILHQRARIHGAMVEAVAESGYEGTSVKRVVGLAGVSRRSFYEQFANKEECFLATFDLIAHRGIQQVTQAYLGTDGDLEDRLRATFEKFAAAANEDRKAALLVLVEAQTVGAAGTLRVSKATAACEQMLSKLFIESPEASALPLPIARGIVGGLHGAVSTLVREGRSGENPDLAEEMLHWTLLFQTSAAAQMTERMAARLAKRMREISRASTHRRACTPAPSGDDRERLLYNALRLAALHDYPALTAPQIADEANVPIDAFFDHFADKDQCYLAALEMVGDELLAIAADPDLTSSDWPRAVRRVIGELLRHLADRPLYARTIAQEAFFAGADAVERNLELAHGIATLLTVGAPSKAQSSWAIEAVAGALWHIVRCQVAAGRIQIIAALSDYVSYVVLAPFIGADAAMEIVTE